MAVADDTAEIAKQLGGLPAKWQAWAQAQVDAALAAQAQQHAAQLEALRAELTGDHADEIAALQGALVAAEPPAAASA